MVTSGTCTIAADQAGNGAYAAAPTVLQSFTVLQPGQINTGLNAAISVALALLDDDGIKANQSITFTQPPDKTFGDAAFGINATSTSGLPISFSSSTASVCSIAGSTVTILGAGLCTITAGQAGDANFNAAPPVARSFTVRKADQTIAFCAGTPKVYGDAPFTVSAIAASGLAVSLTPTTTSVCSVSGSTVSLLSSGTCSITANQAGNANYNAAASVGQSFTVYPTGQTIPPSIPALTATTSTSNINLGSSVTISGNLSGSNSPLNISLNANNVNAGSISCTTGAYSLSSTPTKAGVYTYAVVATDPATGQTVVTAKTKVVVAEVPAATQLVLPATTSTAGATAGSFAVNDMGAAQYSVPIAIPPGIAGMQPSIALSYSSQGGNGHVGMGWSLSGLSSIMRCPKTVAQDGFKSGTDYDANKENDAFCLDGQRLIQIGAKLATDPRFGEVEIREYRTEIDRFDRIESFETTNNSAVKLISGPSNFRVTTKSGQIMDYGWRWWNLNRGNDQNAQDPLRTNTIRSWALDRVSDRNGNFYSVDYAGTNSQPSDAIRGQLTVTGSAPVPSSQASGVAPIGAFPQVEFYPRQMTYTLNSQLSVSSSKVNRIVFDYEDRPANDKQVLFDQGAGQYLISKRLKTISTFVDGNIIDNSLSPSNGQNPPSPICANADCGAKVKEFRLAYESSSLTGRSRLTSLQECASDGVCLPATSFAWTNSSANFDGAASGSFSADGDAFSEFVVADINGDGRSDLVRRYGSGAGFIQALISLPGGGFEQRSLYAQTSSGTEDPNGVLQAGTGGWTFIDLNGDGKADFFAYHNDGYLKTCITNVAATGVTCTTYQSIPRPTSDFYLQGDFNGDGKIDMLFYRGSNDFTFSHNFDLYFGTSTGINPVPRRVVFSIFRPGADIIQRMAVGDFNGDGRADILVKGVPISNAQCKAWWDSFVPDANGFYAPVGDCPAWDRSFQVYFSKPELDATNIFGMTSPDVGVIGPGGAIDKSFTFDFNGDGISDLLSPDVGDGNFGTINFCLSAGDGSFASGANVANPFPGFTPDSLCKRITLPAPFNTRYKKDILFGDFNGDGRTDFATDRAHDGHWIVCLSKIDPAATSGSNPITFDCSGDWPSDPSPNGLFAGADQQKVGDFNGDGKTDFTFGSAGFVKVRTAGGAGLPDMMSGITNGLGAFTNITYAPLTDASVYSKGTDQTGVKLDIQSPLYVVQSTSSSNGIGGTFDTNYKYESLIGQTDGRGLLGFGKKIVSHFNGAATVRTETSYEQEWWKAGRLKSVRKYVDNVLVNEAISSYDWKQNFPYAKVNQVFLVSTIEKSWNINKAGGLEALPYTVTETPLANIDQYGNVAYVKSTTYEPNGTANGYSKETTSAFNAEDSTNWIIGRVSTANVKHNMPGPRSVTRYSGFDYYPLTGQLQVERVEPNSVNLEDRLATAYEYDGYGNRTKATVDFFENGQPKSRSSITRYVDAARNISDPRFVSSSTNALGQTVYYTAYDARWGALRVVTDINNLTATTYYDNFGRKIGEELKDSSNNRLGMSVMTYTPTPNASQPTGFVVNTKNHTGSESQTQMDSLGRAILSSSRTFSGGWATSTTAYDTFGRKAWVSGPKGGAAGVGTYLTTTFEYDKLARATEQVIRRGVNAPTGTEYTRTSNEYSTQALAGTTYSVLVMRQNGAQYGNHTVTKFTDSQGRTARITDNAGKDTIYSYDPLGNLESVVGPGAILESMTYDIRGRKKTSSNANMNGSYSYTYNGAGELIGQTDPKGQSTTMSYDVLGRMTSRVEVGSSATFTSTWVYDNAANGPSAGKLKTASMGSTVHEQKYDLQGRLVQTDSTIDGFVYSRYTLYNAQGQVGYIGYPDGAKDYLPFGVVHAYNSFGYATQIAHDGGANEIYWQATSRYDDGSLATGINGGAPYDKDYDVLGRISTAHLKTADGTTVQTSNYNYDGIGNVLYRGQTFGVGVPAAYSYGEAFCYDALNRVTHAALGNATTDCAAAKQFTYSDDGNLLTKGAAVNSTGAIGNLTYGNGAGGRSANGAGPHAVAVANGKTYVYDNNGNFTNYTDNSRTITYTPFNLPQTIAGNNLNISGLGGITTLGYIYDADHQRVIDSSSSGFVTTYVGSSFFEKVVGPAAQGSQVTTEYRHYIYSPDGIVGIYTTLVSAAGLNLGVSTRYWFKDHLGSPASEYDVAAGVVSNLNPLGFDTWGLRRKGSNTNTFTQSLSTADLEAMASPRGFTGHEHLDEVGLVHMNGRIYDPMIGRFLQPDPVISEPYNSQNFNRYTYVLNNPLAYTDPSGYSLWTEVRRPVAAIATAIATWYIVGPYALAYVSEAGPPTLAAINAANAFTAAASGFAAGGVAGGNIESAVVGAFQGAALSGVGAALDHGGEEFLSETHYVRIAAHAAIGCAAAGLQGGSCGQGAVGAGFAAFVGPISARMNSFGGELAVHSIAGGLGSMAAGGKFANGAVTGAFGYLFNEVGGYRDRGYRSSTSERDRSAFAAETGMVETMGWENPNDQKQGYGYRIKLRADVDSSLFVYAHIDPSSVTVTKGLGVVKGDFIARYADPTNGGATGPHLHFEWWSSKGVRQDPAQYLSTVMPGFTVRDTIRFRTVHPVLGTGRWHNGYDLIGPWGFY